ncbi:hypothetical protein GOP47_0007083 [Adiantum capillus-veneris]|uniref:CHAT domain-containing protein n=1 Tax=Adiantum capillus-veneris TaxID=13818 RepID=A0A9D4ZIY9_ADICA|nr:hypothetical protein GOP47_0007083 [Adiantum capillus-veneris]
MNPVLGEILMTTEFYDSQLFGVGWTIMPDMLSTQVIAQNMALWEMEEVEEEREWRRRFAEAWREGVAAEVGSRREWMRAEAHYLQCWQLLLLPGVEPPKRRCNKSWGAESVYDWICMCVGTRLTTVYQQYAHDFPKALAVVAWLQQRQLYPVITPPAERPARPAAAGRAPSDLPLNRWWPELQRHRALLLFQWSWTEELAGNLRHALRLQALALQRMQEAANQPLPARVIASKSLARIAGNSGNINEARFWSQTASSYWACDRARFSRDWERAVERVSGPINDRWASIISSFHGGQKLFLVSPTAILPRSPLRFCKDVHQCYTQLTLFPRISNIQGTFALGYFPLVGDLANWDEQLMVHFEAGRTADREEQWETAISSYLACKTMIVELADRCPELLRIYRNTAMVIGTQLAHLYQWHLHDYQKCGATLDWLLSMVELPEVSPELLLHRCQVSYQHLLGNGIKDGNDAVQELSQVMALAPNTSPWPDLAAILCLGLAAASALIDPLEASKWLDEAFRMSESWHFEWQVILRKIAADISADMRDFMAVRDHALKLITKLEGKGSRHLEANIHWHLLSKYYCMALDACFLMDGHGSSTEVGLQWDVEAKHLETGLRDKVMDLMEELEKHPLVRLDDYDESKHLAELELTQAGMCMMGYALCRSLGEAISRASGSKGGRMKPKDYTTVLSCVQQEIFFAKTMLSETEREARQVSCSGWHWLIGLSYTKLGELHERQQCNETNLAGLKHAYEAARDHLLQVQPDYTLGAQLMELLGFSYHARSGPMNLDDHKFCALSGVATALGLTLLQSERAGGVSMDAFLEAVAQAEIYSRLPRQNISVQFAEHRDIFSRLPAGVHTAQVTTFYDDLLVKILEKREQRANIQSSWSRVLAIRRLAMIRLYQSTADPESLPNDKYMHLQTLLGDSLVWLEQGLSTLYSFQWLRFYSKNRPPYYSQVLECWPVNPPESEQNTGMFWRIICETRHFCAAQTPPIYQVYYQFSKGYITIFLVDHEDSVEIIEPPMSLEDVEEILRKFYREKPTGPHDILMRLHKILIKPISNSLRNASRVVFIAEQILANVPFAILMDPETGRYLFQQCTVSVAPSALALWQCIRRYTSASGQSEDAFPMKPALVVADPAYLDPDFPRLPYSFEEIKAVQMIFKEKMTGCSLQVEEKVGMEATVKAVLEAAESPGRNRPFIHFAVHAGTEQKRIPHTDFGRLQYGGIKQGTIYLADPLVKEWPALGYIEHLSLRSEEEEEETRALSKKKKSKGKSTKKKKMSHPSEWQLGADDHILGREKAWNVDMVVLSACESSKGQVLQSGSYLNLPRALTLAGVPCVVAAQWPVEDACSTPRLMQYFYQGMKDGLDASTALQVSMQKMLADGQYSVYQWGAFMVWGLPTVRLPIEH